MKIICELSGIVDYNRPSQGTIDIKTAGFQQIFVDLNHLYKKVTKENVEHFMEKFSVDELPFLKTTRAVVEKCKAENIHIFALRSPYLPIDTKRTDLNEIQQQMAEEVIEFCGEAEVNYVIVQPIFAGVDRSNEWLVNKEYYSSLARTARENNVMILLENQYRTYNGHIMRGICSDGKEAAKWVDKLNDIAGEERFGFCMNTGTCSLCGQNMHEYAISLGSRIKAVVLRDCDGHNETSMLPFTAVNSGESQTDWLSLIRGLRDISFDGGLILDIEDTAVAFSPILRPQLLTLAKATADYFRWQIEIENQLKKYKSIVLFGAGNMCRNYMKCYGEKYPPMFTCDNNSKAWGTNFCGLEVKSPEALKSIPADCGIFICNIYYREIEKQLRDMGIKNNIEFFNDEYMPSFYFDRLERM
ncbi:sugar phosphate isomerase/epimerase family protein [Clostridium thermarum]|uniref:sugar phosphate isomerase/epimerase family protein n=1 Tax=Clostridium thermarum TaxID=1716543 RepID=UPI0011245B24|nr:TIM barrel protein [Clostridium thermarum]